MTWMKDEKPDRDTIEDLQAIIGCAAIAVFGAVALGAVALVLFAVLVLR